MISAAARFPPGPRSPLLSYLALRRDPLAFMTRMARTYGPITHLRIGKRHDYLLNHPDYVQKALADPALIRSSSRPLRRLLGQGVLTTSGESHHAQRRGLQPLFHRQHTPRWAETIVRAAEKVRRRWRTGTDVDVAVEMLALSQGVIVELVLGLDPDRDAHGLMPALRAVVEAVNRNTFPSLAELFLPVSTPKVAALERAIAALDPILMALVAERRASRAEGHDMLSAMLQMSEDPSRGRRPMTDVELRDEVITMISAGHETIGNALTWTWLLLAQHPDVEATMHAELESVLAGRLPTLQDLAALPFVEAVLKESMRLYPPVWVVARKTPGEWTLGDYVVPAGAYLQVCPYVTQRDPDYFDAAEAFKPERWLTSDAGARYKGAYFPFAAGSHRCIGESLAWTEGILALATLAQQWSLALVRPGYTAQPEAAITLRPRGGLPMTLRARTGALAA